MEGQGIILRGVGGFYYVSYKGVEYECRARGNFRVKDQKPLVGDMVCFRADPPQTGYILEILPRRNELVRPAVANVDQLVVVAAPKEPLPDLLLADKLMLHARIAGIEPLLCINKCDLDADAAAALCGEYEGAADVVMVSALTGEGVEALVVKLQGKVSCFAGQSAAGKSSLINSVCPHARMQTGGLSKHTQRGRHTTRHTSLLPVPGGYVVDTPGFSLCGAPLAEPEALGSYYPEMQPLTAQCAFAQCLHLSEPGCAVRGAVGMPRGRYLRYEQLVREAMDRKERRYD